MTRTLLVVTAVVLVFAFVAAAQSDIYRWAQIPWNSKIRFEIRGIASISLEIELFLHTEEVWKAFYGDDWNESQDTIDKILRATQEIWPGRDVFYVAVQASQSTYFWPTEFFFLQGSRQYNLGYSDVLAATDPFRGGAIHSGVIAQGFVAIPTGIDMNRPFKIQYGNGVLDSATFDPHAEKPVFFLEVKNEVYGTAPYINVFVKTLPTAICTIDGGHFLLPTGLPTEIADKKGRVLWSWKVDSSVPVGSYPLIITAVLDGKKLTESIEIQIIR